MKIILKLNFFLICSIFFFNNPINGENIKQAVTVTAKTATYNGEFAPQNGILIWIQKQDKTFIKTIYRAVTAQYLQYFTVWKTVSGGLLPALDGLTGASHDNHNDTIVATWDCTNHDKQPVPHGTYEYWIEMSEDNGPGKTAHGTIEIDGVFKKVQAASTAAIPVLEANYYNSLHTINNFKTTTITNLLPVICNNKQISIELPNTGTYSVSLISPSGKTITQSSGTGKKAIVAINNHQVKSGVYVIKIVQSGKTYTLQHILGL
jgi:hypothetical protein